MKRLFALLVTVLLAGVASAAWGGSKEEVAEVSQRTEQAWNEPSPDALLAQYAEDATFTPALSPFFTEGRKELAVGLVAFFKAFPTRRLSIRQSSTRIYGDNVAVIDGYWGLTGISAKGEAKTWNGRFSITRVKMGGQWLIVSHHSSLLPSQ